MLRKTMFFLILLRLAIGWHFFFEGYHKIHSDEIGPTETSKPFSSEMYFREATGPLGPLMLMSSSVKRIPTNKRQSSRV